ncbi:unnamed protein product, partial [Polarella glacialis]
QLDLHGGHNHVVESSRGASPAIPAVQVCVRVRPLLDWECSDGLASSCLQLAGSPPQRITLLPRDGVSSEEELNEKGRIQKPREFAFNAVFGPASSQQEVWDQVGLGNLVCKVVEGFHATVFAYGQTGSGKTHTMDGFAYGPSAGTAPSALAKKPKVHVHLASPEQLGVVPRAVRELFARIDLLRKPSLWSPEGETGESFDVKVSFLQIYNERLYDLLNPATLAVLTSLGAAGASGEDGGQPGLRLRWDAAKEHFYVENLFEYGCHSAE